MVGVNYDRLVTMYIRWCDTHSLDHPAEEDEDDRGYSGSFYEDDRYGDGPNWFVDIGPTF